MAGMDVEYVSKLARIKLSDEERRILSDQMSNILSYVEKLNQLDTNSVSETQHILALQNILRPDVVKTSIAAQKVLKHAPSSRDQFFIVPSVIE